MKNIKKLCRSGILLLLVTILTIPSVFAVTIPSPTADFYVNDFANVLTEAAESEISTGNGKLETQNGAQIVVVTMQSLGGEDIEKFSYALFNDWGIGSADKNNGLLLVLAIQEEDYWLMPGKGLENIISDGQIAVWLDTYLEPDFADGNYSEGVIKLFRVMETALYKAYGGSADVSGNNGNVVRDDDDGNSSGSAFGWIFSGIFSIIALIIAVAIVIAVLKAFFRILGSGGGCCMFPFWFGGCGGPGGGGHYHGGGFGGGHHGGGGFGGFGGFGGGGHSGGGGFGGGGSFGGSHSGGGGGSFGGGAGRGGGRR